MKYPKMLRDIVLVKSPKETKTKGGIELPSSAVEEKKLSAAIGEAVACGKDCETVKVGDRVLAKSYVGNLIEDETFDQDYWYTAIAELDIICVWPKNR